MVRHRLLAIAAAAGLCLVHARPALAYLDPGTQSQVVQLLAVFIGAAGASLGLLLWPLRRLARWLKTKYGPRAARILIGAAALVLIGGALGAAALLGLLGDWEGSHVLAIHYDRPDRVILLGLDGLDPGLTAEMMDKGELPNFDRLRKTGSFLPLEISLPPETPVSWSSIATGVNPGKHGIFDFLHRDPKTYRPILSVYKVNTRNLTDRREKRYLPVRLAKGFWSFASEAGVPATVIRWPAAFPPEPVTVHFLSGLGVPDVRGGLGAYSLLTTDPKEPGPSFRGRSCSGAWADDTFRGRLAGPIVAGLTGRKESELDVVVRRLGRTEVSLRVGDSSECKLGVGQWSDYIPVQFAPGWGKKVPAMVHAYLAALDPHLRLYVSTPEVDPAAPYFPITFPDAFATDLAAAIGRYTTLGMPEDVNAVKEGTLPPEAFERRLLALFAERKKQFDYEFKRFDRGLFAFVFDDSDRIQHMFWATRDKEHPAYDPAFAARFAHVIPDMYKRADAVLGEVLAAVDSHTTLIVVSDHGFNTFRTRVGLNSWLVENGYMTLKTADGRNGRELFADVDWARTRAYAVGFTNVYLNLKGREQQGVVNPGAEAQRLIDELAAKLRTLADPATGKPAVRGVYATRDAYRGPFVDDGPDLVVGFHLGFRMEDSNAIGGAPAQVFADNTSLWSGDHLMDPHVVPGIFFSNRKPTTDRPRGIDIAPTILQCVGVKPPDSMDGTPLFGGR